jgi:hypothetical protein
MMRRISLWIVELAVRALPAGEIRSRYQREFAGELHGLGRTRQLRHALTILCTAPALRVAVRRSGLVPVEAVAAPVKPPPPMMCRLHLRHHWQRESTEDGSSRFWRCDRCGKDRFSGNGGNVVWLSAEHW